MKEIEIKIAAFIASPKLKTRSGASYEVTSFQKDGNGNVTALVGTVNEDGKDIPMMWTSNGNALCNKPMIYDLVEELAIADLGKEETEEEAA